MLNKRGPSTDPCGTTFDNFSLKRDSRRSFVLLKKDTVLSRLFFGLLK